MMRPELVIELFVNPKGKEMLYGVGILFVVGYFWAKNIVKIEV